MEQSFLHSFYEVVFTFLPVPFFLQFMDLWATILNSFYGLFGIDFKFIGF